MAMVVRTNINSMNANRNLSINNSQVAKSLEKLASGYAINRAADDASGLAVSEKMRAQITGLDQGTENALDGVCLIQTAEGAMDEIHNMLNRITELATKSANGTIQDEVDREAIQAEVDVLIDEIDRIAQATNYNGIPLLDGSLADSGCSKVELSIDSAKIVMVGSFTITGGVQGVDFDYDNNTGQLSILSSTHMRIEGGSDTENIVVDDSAGSANLALKNVNITSDTGSAFSTGNNDVYIELEGSNELSSTYAVFGVGVVEHDGTPGLNVGEYGSITIDGDGVLSASSQTYAAAIGSGFGGSSGDITINGGTIIANAYGSGAGIGSGFGGSSGDIIINGGTITANSSVYGAGIGSGESGSGGNIVINGGNISASSGAYGAGIGSGGWATIGDISITGGIVNAIGGFDAAGIGAGRSGIAGDIKVTETNITAIGGATNSGGTNVGIGAGQVGPGAELFEESYVGTITYIETTTSTSTSSIICGEPLILHVADENENYNKIKVYIDPMTGEALEIKPLYVDTQEAAGAAIDKIRNAINYVSENRANLGALQNRLERTVNNNNNTSENMSSAVSTIKDTDMAAEMMRYTTMNVLTQSAQSMLAQSNQAPQAILSLLG